MTKEIKRGIKISRGYLIRAIMLGTPSITPSPTNFLRNAESTCKPLQKAEKNWEFNSTFPPLNKDMANVAVEVINTVSTIPPAIAEKAVVDVRKGTDKAMGGHNIRVLGFCGGMASISQLSEREWLILAISAILHDAGKIRKDIREVVLSGTSFDDDPTGKELIEEHPKVGSLAFSEIKEYIMQHFGLSKEEANTIEKAIEFHHENMDGSGYYGKKEEEIPWPAGWIRIGDTSCATNETKCRPHKKSRKSTNESSLILKEGSKILYDPEVVKVGTELLNQMTGNLIHYEKKS